MPGHSPWATRADAIRPFYVMDVLERAKRLQAEGRDIVRMEVGEPGFATPAPVLEAGLQALKDDRTNYTPALGIPPLREAIAAWYGRTYGVDLSPERVVITPGTSGAFLLAFGLLLDPGDRVAITDPGYPCYPNIIRLLGGEPVTVPVTAEAHYQFTPEALAPLIDEGGGGLKAALVTSPSNPTGTLIPDPAFQGVLEVVEQGGGVVVSDEIYHGITYGVRARSALEFSDRAIIVNGFSKFFAMTGWRLGWLIVPEEAVRRVEILAQNLFISASTLSQHAALKAFDVEPDLAARIAEYDEKRRYLLAHLPGLGFHVAVEPRGAFYIYADVGEVLSKLDLPDARELSRVLLEEAGVAVTPGLDFGRHGTDRFMRFSYAAPLARIREGVDRLRLFLQAAESPP